MELVSTLEIPDLYFNKLTISNSYIVKVTSRPSRIISIWSLKTGELVKKINLPLPFTLESPSLSGTLLSYNHFIMRFSYSCCRRKQLLLVYDIEELLTQSKFKPRQFIIDDFHRFGDSLEAGCMIINKNKTKLLVSDEKVIIYRYMPIPGNIRYDSAEATKRVVSNDLPDAGWSQSPQSQTSL